jgi:hypothetical protein
MFYNRVIFSELQKMKPQAKTEKRVVPFYGNLSPNLRNCPDHHPATEEKRTGRQGRAYSRRVFVPNGTLT